MKLQKLNRFHAFGGHLLVSIGVAVLSSMLVFLLWYPGPLAQASGVRNIFLLLLAVDVILGPVITLIVFNPEKKELKRDLLVVAALQLGALIYGMQAVYTARPVYIVYSIDRFDLVFANDFTNEKLAKVSKTEYGTLPQMGPKLIAVRKPEDPKAHKELLFRSLAGGDDLPHLPEYYVPYAEQKTDLLKRVRPLAELKKFNKDKGQSVDALVAKYAAAKVDASYLPLRGKVKDLVVIVDRNTGTLLEMTDLAPW